jgi:hypothetical protein
VSFVVPKGYRRAFDRLVEAEISIVGVCLDAIAAKAAYLERRPNFEEGDEIYVLTKEQGLYNGLHGVVKGFWNELVEVVLQDGRVVMFNRYDIKIGDW